MKIPFVSSLLKIKEQSSSWNLLVFWYRHYKLLFFTGFLIVLSLGGWDYYYSIFKFRFTVEEKKQYVDSYFKETIFNADKFHDVIDGLSHRAEMHNEPLLLNHDIFEIKK